MNLADLLSFYKEERKIEKKSSSFMKQIYKNRIEANLSKDRDAIMFLFDKIGLYHHDGGATKTKVEKLTFGFEELVGKDVLWKGIDTYLQTKRANLPKSK